MTQRKDTIYMKKLKHLFLFIAVLCVTCIMSAAVSAAETYTDVGAVEITLHNPISFIFFEMVSINSFDCACNASSS